VAFAVPTHLQKHRFYEEVISLWVYCHFQGQSERSACSNITHIPLANVPWLGVAVTKVVNLSVRKHKTEECYKTKADTKSALFMMSYQFLRRCQ
jgi:hypothetical protein